MMNTSEHTFTICERRDAQVEGLRHSYRRGLMSYNDYLRWLHFVVVESLVQILTSEV